MNYRSIFASAILAMLIGVTNSGNALWARGGGGGGGSGGSSHSGMGGGGSFGGMSMGGSSFHSGMGGSSRGFSGSGFTSSSVGRAPSQSFNGNFHSQSFNGNQFSRGSNFESRGQGNMNRQFSHDAQHPVNPQAWHNNNNNWWRNNGGRDFDHDHDRDFDHFNRFAFIPFWWNYSPFYAWYGYPYYNDYYDYGYPADYYYSSYGPDTDTSPAYADQYAASAPIADPSTDISDETATTTSDWGNQFLTSAREAFRGGDYSNALRLANHSVVETPRNAKAHELMSLSFFALKDYAKANLEAHVALSLAPAADWNTLYRYYGDLPTYTKQLDALGDYVQSHKDATDAKFVIAYQNLMMGHKDVAIKQFQDVIAKIPKDQVAAKIINELGGSAATVEKSPPSAPLAKEPPKESE